MWSLITILLLAGVCRITVHWLCSESCQVSAWGSAVTKVCRPDELLPDAPVVPQPCVHILFRSQFCPHVCRTLGPAIVFHW